jgi:anti-sigma B factor antagonist
MMHPHPNVGQRELLHIRESLGFTVIELHGEIDIATAQAVRPELDALITDRPSPAVAVDLRYTTFIDAAGLGLLVRTRQQALEHGGRWHLVCDRPLILRILRITSLTATLRPAATLEQAVLLAVPE